MTGFSPVWLRTIEKVASGQFKVSSVPAWKDLHKMKKQAAVFVPLCNIGNTASILFTLRTQSVGTHKGQVSFPGGHLNPGESAVDAAVRETHEELGIAPNLLIPLGTGQQIPSITGTAVTPILGFIDVDAKNLPFHPNPGEVDRVFFRSLDELLDPTYRKIEPLDRNGVIVQMPYFGSKDDPECIWGLTGLILNAVLENVILPSLELS